MTLWLCTCVLGIVCSYQRRNKFNPLWNEVLVAGYKNGKPFLGQLDMIGTAFEDNCLATGFGTLSCPTCRTQPSWVSKSSPSRRLGLV